jgi:hypothetical protein
VYKPWIIILNVFNGGNNVPIFPPF